MGWRIIWQWLNEEHQVTGFWALGITALALTNTWNINRLLRRGK